MATCKEYTTLKNTDLKVIQRKLWKARTKWRAIGIELDIDPEDLNAIKEKQRDDPDKCLPDMISKWLKKARNANPPTWTDICSALRADAVGNAAIADELEKELPTLIQSSQLTQKCDEHIVLNTRQQFEAKMLLRCFCGNCTLHLYLSQGCPMSSIESASYPYLEVRKLSDSDKEDLIQKLTHETTLINKSFAQLFMSTSKSFKAKCIQVDELANAALSIGAFESDATQKPLLLQDEKDLLQAKTIDMAFIILRRHMSFFNYEILAHLIESHGSDEDSKKLEEYEMCFKQFCQRKVFEVSPNVVGRSPSQRSDEKAFFVLLLTKSFASTLNDVVAAKRKLATLLGLKSSTLHLHRIDEGSIALLVSIPGFVAEAIFPLSTLKQIKLRAEGFEVIQQDQLTPGQMIPQILTSVNYKPKFCSLLNSEEATHSKKLKERCDGSYYLHLHQSGLKRPQWMSKSGNVNKFHHVRYGYLVGINGDKISYAVQAAQDESGVILLGRHSKVCTADILPENYSHTDEVMYIGFDQKNHDLLCLYFKYQISLAPCNLQVDVEFDLKHFYFDSLRKFITSLKNDTIIRLIPKQSSFAEKSANGDSLLRLDNLKNICSMDQIEALKTIVSCSPRGPPILISGPFGTGKTYILAVAAHFLFLDNVLKNKCAHILVCTHHKRSTDNFLEIFENLHKYFPLSKSVSTLLIRDYGQESTSKLVKKYCVNSRDVVQYMRKDLSKNHKNFLIVTTCMTSHRLTYKRCFEDFFTHILLDEGAQMREPEAIAPLNLAHRNTKIVITGDHQQVGPSMLVLGDKARQHGLDKSLLERLLNHYSLIDDSITKQSIATLSTNYRCHPAIFTLVGNLFYHDQNLKTPTDADVIPSSHPCYPSCFVFVCSNFDETITNVETNVNEFEAKVLLKNVQEVFKSWPRQWGYRDLSQCCIMSPSRSQLTLMSRLINDLKSSFPKLRFIRHLPTYDMQGREFKALFLSTSEPVIDGNSLNPTKSFSNRYVFNTAVTRAASLVVSVGNPFLLLKMEENMILNYGYDEQCKCWSTYLKDCLANKTVIFDDALALSRTKQKRILRKLHSLVEEQLLKKVNSSKRGPTLSVDQVVLSTNFAPLALQKRSLHGQFQIANNQTLEKTQASKPKQTPISTDNAKSNGNDSSLHSAVNVKSGSIKDQSSRFDASFKVLEIMEGMNQCTFHVKSVEDSKHYRVQMINIPEFGETIKRDELMHEAEILSKISSHANIITFYDSWVEKAQPRHALSKKKKKSIEDATVADMEKPKLPMVLMIQTELYGNTSLQEWLQQTSRRRKMTVITFFEQILDALCYIHRNINQSLGLNPTNIILDLTRESFLKLCDTRLSDCALSGNQENDSNFKFYLSPEQLTDSKRNTEADIYALGIIFFELNCPFVAKELRIEVLTDLRETSDIPKQFEDGVPKEITTIVRQLVNHDPDARPTALDIQSDRHNYLKQLKKKANKKPFLEATLTLKYMKVNKEREPRKKVLCVEPKEPDCSVGIEHLIDRVPQPFEIKCPICIDVIKKPHQTECCGTDFCKECIERIMIDRKPCPTCKHKGIKLYPNKGLQREVYKLHIKCIYNDSGCKWIGELGQLDSHLNSKPQTDKQLEGCKFVKIECIYCCKKLKRLDISVHQKDRCQKRPFTCHYCKSYESNYKNVVKEHWPVCVLYPVECSNCGEKVARQGIKKHLSNDCPKVEIMCAIGCKQTMPSKDMLTHLIDVHVSERMKQFFFQAKERQIVQLERERRKVHILEDENQRLQDELKVANLAKKKEKSKISDLKLSSHFKSTPGSVQQFLIQAPPDYIQIECPVCLNIVKEPHQVQCCGSNFCHTCIQCALSTKGSCPFCKSQLKDAGFFNRGRERAVRQLMTHCSNKGEGCKWKGEYGKLDKHLDPKEIDCCGFLKVKCINCDATIESRKKQIHTQNECQKRPYRCPYCKMFKSTYEDVTTNHWHVCNSYPILCPLKCDKKVQRKYIAEHLQTHGPNSKFSCYCLQLLSFVTLFFIIIFLWFFL